MKAIFAILALFLVAQAHAGIIEEPVNYEELINGIINEAKQAAADSTHELEEQFESLSFNVVQGVEDILDRIQKKREETKACVIAQGYETEQVVKDMFKATGQCGVDAVKTTVQIANDINKSAQQLIFDGIDLLKTYRKCKRTTNTILKRICDAELAIKVAFYALQAPSSIKTIRGAPKRVPLIYTDAKQCGINVSEKTVTDLENVANEIDACVRWV